jgi:hypothetical protein
MNIDCQRERTECMLTETRIEMAFMANKTALFADFKASSRVTKSFFRSASVSISVITKNTYKAYQAYQSPSSPSCIDDGLLFILSKKHELNMT